MPYYVLQADSPFKDALHHRAYVALKEFTDWLGRENAVGYIGEFGWPNDSLNRPGTPPYGDTAQYNALADAWYGWANQANLWVSAWNASSQVFVNQLIMYSASSAGTNTIDTPQSQAATFEAHPETVNYRRGINHSSAERTDVGGQGFSNAFLGTFDTDQWRYPSQATLNYLYARGARLIRLPVRWERLQPTLGGLLSATEVTRITDTLTRMNTAGTDMKCVLDIHNYAAYIKREGGQNVTYKLGSSGLTQANFADLWTRLSNSFRTNATMLGYSIMNEPSGMPGATGLIQGQLWESMSQAAVDAIRATGDTKVVFIPNYLGIASWSSQHPDKWITDSANNTRYELHFYFDYEGGAYLRSYNAEVAIASGEGY